MTITLNGKTCWSAGGGLWSVPIVTLKEGQSVQQAVDEMRANSFAFFDTVKLPRTVLKPKELLPPGKSTLNESGIEDAPLPPLPEPTPLGPLPVPAPAPANTGEGFE